MTGQKRMFSTLGNNKGLVCPFGQLICQEGICVECEIYRGRLVDDSPLPGCRNLKTWVSNERSKLQPDSHRSERQRNVM